VPNYASLRWQRLKTFASRGKIRQPQVCSRKCDRKPATGGFKIVTVGIICGGISKLLKRDIAMNYIKRTLLAFVGLLALSQGPAQATEYPYCLFHVEAFGGGIEQCDFTTMDQCRMSASGLGGSCTTNWRLALNRSEQQQTMSQPPRKRIHQ
jgi:hypothetical protein